MNALPLLLALLLLVQGITILFRADRKPWHSWAGVLTLDAALLTVALVYCLSRQRILVLPELRAILTAGPGANALRLVLVLFALSDGLLLLAARAARERRPMAALVLAVSLAVGCVSAGLVQPIDASNLALGLYRYDLLSPLLLLWHLGCLLEWALVVLDVKDSTFRALLASLLVLCLSGIAAAKGTDYYADTNTHWHWAVAFGMAVAAVSGLGLRFVLSKAFSWFFEKHPRARWLSTVLWGCMAIFGICVFLPFAEKHETCTIVASILAASIVVGFVLFRFVRALKAAPEACALQERRAVISWTLLGTLAAIIAFSFDITFFRWLPDWLTLLVMGLATIVLTELTSDGPLLEVAPSVWSSLVGGESQIRKGVERAFHALLAFASVLMKPVRWIFSFTSVTATIGKLCVALVLLIALDELPNRNKTIVRPFDASGIHDADKKPAIGAELAKRVVHRMGELAAGVRTGVLVYQTDSTSPERKLQMAPSLETGDGVQAALQNDFVEIGSVKIPLGLILTPIQRSLELFFGMRFVTGSLQQRGEDYSLLSTSTAGDTWPEETTSAKASGSDAAGLAERLAFSIVSTDPGWRRAGMTMSSEAFDAYSEGLLSLTRYERMLPGNDQVADRVAAIESFRRAVGIDPKFSLAHYHLGIALQADGERSAAETALRNAVRFDPLLGVAYNQLAQLLASYDEFLPAQPGALLQRATGNSSRRNEAYGYFAHVAFSDHDFPSKTDRGSAYLGLCSLSLNDAEDASGFQTAFYLCAQALRLYDSMPIEANRVGELARTRAAILNQMAVILVRRDHEALGQQAAAQSSFGTDWDCSADAAQVKNHVLTWKYDYDLRNVDAARLFRQAHELDPDDAVFLCNLAHTKELLSAAGKAEIQGNTKIELNLGSRLRSRAGQLGDSVDASVLFRASLEAFYRAVQADPYDVEALNNFAYTYRVWQLQRPDLDEAEQKSDAAANLAEQYVRRALRLAEARGPETLRTLVRSTLGEVLLARGRPHEAIDVLEQGHSTLPMHASYNEVRWDLLQAFGCAKEADEVNAAAMPAASDPHSCSGPENKMAQLTQELYKLEATREAQPFFLSGRSLPLPPCARTGKAFKPSANDAYSMSIMYGNKTGCSTALVRVVGVSDDAVYAHFWGRDGINEWLQPADFKRTLEVGPALVGTHLQYFAQLFSAEKDPRERQPLSPVYAISTPGSENGACVGNLIELTISKANAPQPR